MQIDAYKAFVEASLTARDKEPNELTDMERMSVLFFAGVEIETRMEGDKLVMRTRRRAGLAKVDGKFYVAEEAPRKGDTITFRVPPTEPSGANHE